MSSSLQPLPQRPLSEAHADKTQRQRGTHRTGSQGGEPGQTHERTGDHTPHVEWEQGHMRAQGGSQACSWWDIPSRAAPQHQLTHTHPHTSG